MPEPREESSSWTSCAERKSSTPSSASSTAWRWGVERGPGPTGSVLVIVLPLSGDVDRVAVAVVDVVDMDAGLDREVATPRPRYVGMALVRLFVQRQRIGVVRELGATSAVEDHAD